MDLTGKNPEEIQELVNSQETLLVEKESLLEKANQTIAEQEEKIGVLNGIIGKAKAQTEISTKADANKAPVIPTDLVKIKEEVDGKTVTKKYKWQKARFRLMGETTAYTAEQAAKDPEVLKKLLAIDGQQVLVEQA